MNACISTEGLSDAEAVEKAKEFSGLIGVDFVKEVTATEPYEWDPMERAKRSFQRGGYRSGG